MSDSHSSPDLADVLQNGRGSRRAFHRHILFHAESQMGMFGMVTALIIHG